MDLEKFIDDNIYLFKNKYYKKLFNTKLYFFDFLQKGKNLDEFKMVIDSIWQNHEFKFMDRCIEDLEKFVSQLNMNDLTIENIQIENLNQLIDKTVFDALIEKYKNNIVNEFNSKLNSIENLDLDKDLYLSNYVDKFDKMQTSIPYFNKDGTIRSWHNIADYCTMAFNSNLTRAGWNRTLYDAKALDNDLLYLPAHSFACPKCAMYQGKVYSLSGNNKNYPSQSEAINGGVGHPNCKHQWLLYWEGITEIQKEKYNSSEWEEKYKNKQKINSLNLEIKKSKVNIELYNNLNQNEKLNKEKLKIKKYKSKINELKENL